jgi:exonuclease SbcC
MRLHHLEVTAFGPFADTVAVDLDALSEAGLFLLTGPTGAGKSSVLDAICFALYGDVPGDRGSARRLRCDLAAPGVAPTVVLEATLSGRRFRIERSPAWERPKKRGTGTTVQQAGVCILERIDDEWVTLSTRLDETGHLVARLVGMTLPQFCQVAMLPQGRFQAFLRARSEDRHALLQRVFRTDRFDRVEKHLRDHRLALRRRSTEHEREVADLVARVSEAAGDPCPDGWDDDLPAMADRGEVAAWATGLAAAAHVATEQARAEHESATVAEKAGRESLEAGRATADLHDRFGRARAVLDRLAADEEAHQARRDELDAARRASGVVPLLVHAERASDAVARRREDADAAVARVAELGVETSHEALELARAEAAALQARVEAARPRAAELLDLDRGLAELAGRIESLAGRLAVVDARADTLPEELAGARTAAQAAGSAVAALADVEDRVAGLGDRLGAHRRLAELEPLLVRARASSLDAREHVQAAREAWLAVREARLDGMAAEIATALAVGDSCPVCGSADHPHPAVPAPGAPDAAAEKAARRQVDDAEITLQAAEEELRTLETGVAVARQ